MDLATLSVIDKGNEGENEIYKVRDESSVSLERF